MKILQIVDCDGWAISNLVNSINKHLKDRFDLETIYVHPREVIRAHKLVEVRIQKGVDLVNYHYWRSATQLLEFLPHLKNLPNILSHWNHESLEKQDWRDFYQLTHPTKYGEEKLRRKHPNVRRIQMGLDLNRYTYIDEYPPKEIKIGYVGRIVPWKRIDLICEVAKELGYKVIGSGYIDKPNYWKEKVEKYEKDGTLEFNGGIGRGNIPAPVFKDNLYKQMTIFVMASEGEYESGPLPAQEAMARGIPVLATEKGTLKDRCKDGHDIIYFKENDKEDFKQKMKMLVEDQGLRNKIRKEARKTAIRNTEEKMAREFGRLYYEVYSSFKKEMI